MGHMWYETPAVAGNSEIKGGIQKHNVTKKIIIHISCLTRPTKWGVAHKFFTTYASNCSLSTSFCIILV